MGIQRFRIILSFLIFTALSGSIALRADDGNRGAEPNTGVVNQANAPISSILQIRLQDTYVPRFTGVKGEGNTFTVAVTMPLPRYRLLPFPQLSLVSIPAAVTLPNGMTGLGDVRFVDIAVFHGGSFVWGVGPTFVFPTSSTSATGQGKWQAGPAVAAAFLPERWLLAVLAQNPISFAGDGNRKDTNALFLQAVVSYQLGKGWFVRSQPQMLFNWETSRQTLPVDLGIGRVFKIGRQDVNCFVEPFWNVSRDGPSPKNGVMFGLFLIYPDFWKGK